MIGSEHSSNHELASGNRQGKRTHVRPAGHMKLRKGGDCCGPKGPICVCAGVHIVSELLELCAALWFSAAAAGPTSWPLWSRSGFETAGRFAWQPCPVALAGRFRVCASALGAIAGVSLAAEGEADS